MPPSWPLMDSPGLRGRSSRWTPAAAGFTASPYQSLKIITLRSSAPNRFSTGLVLTQCPLCHRWISKSLHHWLLRACPSHPLSLFCVCFGLFSVFSFFFLFVCFCLFVFKPGKTLLSKDITFSQNEITVSSQPWSSSLKHNKPQGSMTLNPLLVCDSLSCTNLVEKSGMAASRVTGRREFSGSVMV